MGAIEDALGKLDELKSGILAQQEQGDVPGADWFAAYQSFSGVGPGPHGPGTGPVMAATDGYMTNSYGYFMYQNGAIADPNTGSVWFPPTTSSHDPAEVPGSPQWLIAIAKDWSDSKAERWRKRLWEDGYVGAGMLQSESGGMAEDLKGALAAYHQQRYLNQGRPLALVPKDAQSAANIRKSFDMVALKEEAKEWGQVPFEEPLDDDTASYFADRVMHTAIRLVKEKGWDPQQALAGAEVRVQKEFLEDPSVAGAMKEAADDEMSTKLRDSIVSVSQLGSI